MAAEAYPPGSSKNRANYLNGQEESTHSDYSKQSPHFCWTLLDDEKNNY